jgi:hypothetical protein
MSENLIFFVESGFLRADRLAAHLKPEIFSSIALIGAAHISLVVVVGAFIHRLVGLLLGIILCLTLKNLGPLVIELAKVDEGREVLFERLLAIIFSLYMLLSWWLEQVSEVLCRR